MFDKFNTEVLCQVLCFGDQEKLELAILSIGYAEGLIDALIFLGEIELEW